MCKVKYVPATHVHSCLFLHRFGRAVAEGRFGVQYAECHHVRPASKGLFAAQYAEYRHVRPVAEGRFPLHKQHPVHLSKDNKQQRSNSHHAKGG